MNEFDDWDFVRNPAITTATGSPSIIIAENIDSNGVSTPISLALGQTYNVYGYGSFDGATVDVEWSIDFIGERWVLQTSGTNNSLQGAVFANNLYVAVGTAGKIVTSPDTIVWTTQTGAGASFLRSVGFGIGLYVAVGSLGDIFTSPDGITWTTQTSGATQNFRYIIFANGLFVAVGEVGIIFTSPDAITWTSRNSTTTNILRAIAFGNGLFVVVGDLGKILTSPDGITWTQQDSPISTLLTNVTFTGDIFLAISDSSTVPNIMISSDGILWETSGEGISGVSLTGLNFALGIYFVGGVGGKLFTSRDATTWTERNSQTSQFILSIIEGNDISVFFGDTGTIGTNVTQWTALEDFNGIPVQFTSQEVFTISRIGAEIHLRTNTTGSGSDTDVTVDLR